MTQFLQVVDVMLAVVRVVEEMFNVEDIAVLLETDHLISNIIDAVANKVDNTVSIIIDIVAIDDV